MKDLTDLQGAIKPTCPPVPGPCALPGSSPEPAACDLDMVALLEHIMTTCRATQFTQLAHAVLLELVIEQVRASPGPAHRRMPAPTLNPSSSPGTPSSTGGDSHHL